MPPVEAPAAAHAARLIVVNAEPFNAETPLTGQLGLITPNALHYVRSNFAIPCLAAANWRLSIEGEVARPLRLSYQDLQALPRRSLLVTMECAGNGRSAFSPPACGEPWQYGAVSTAEWTGVPLAALLELAGLTDRAREIVIEGADRGSIPARPGLIPFARSLPAAAALHPDTVLALAMNGEPLSAAHGFPARLIVPGWYGMAAVKWVTRIVASAVPFDGYFQTERYVLIHAEQGETAPVPLSSMLVRSLITEPAAGATLPGGTHRLRGLAWTGTASVTAVEVSVDGQSWERAELSSPAAPYVWRQWEYLWQARITGPTVLRSRARDSLGGIQPSVARWNPLGYANNAVQCVGVTVI